MNTFGVENIRPMLTEPGVKYFINETLKQCHQFKEKYHNLNLNIGLLVLFFIILGILLLYKYKGKITPEEIKEKELQKKTIYFIKN